MSIHSAMSANVNGNAATTMQNNYFNSLDDLLTIIKTTIQYNDEYICVIDQKLNIQYISNNFVDLFDAESISKINNPVGKNIIECFHKNSPIKAYLDDFFNKLLINKTTKSYLGINLMRKPQYATMLFKYSPILEPVNKNVVAIIIRGYLPAFPALWASMPHILKSFRNQTKQPLNPENKHFSTEDVLFLLSNLDSYENIANILSIRYENDITVNAIGKYTRRVLYNKLKVYNMKALKEKAIENGYHKMPPLTLLVNMLIDTEHL